MGVASVLVMLSKRMSDGKVSPKSETFFNFFSRFWPAFTAFANAANALAHQVRKVRDEVSK
jgi:hypothetical protein